MRTINKNTMGFVVMCLAAFTANAQVIPPPPGTPIDSGIGFLVAIAVGYGIKKLRK